MKSCHYPCNSYVTFRGQRGGEKVITLKFTFFLLQARQVANSGSGASVPTNFKDLIEWKAEQNNIIFLPVPNKYHEAKQVYRFGNVQIVLDRRVVFVQEGQLWMPCSVNELVRRAK